MTVSTRPAEPVTEGDLGLARNQALVHLLKAAADPLRLDILRVLRNNAFGALELSNIFAMRQNAMSHHLKLLTRAGLVSYRREGTHIFYRRSNPLNGPGAADCGGVYQAILATLDEPPLPEELRGRIAQVETERASRSREFFRANADKFREQQDLIAGHAQYGAVVEHLLETVSGVGNGSALEVGPGEGELLPAICRHFDRVTALDNSTEMLERSRQLARRQGLGKIDFCHGDTGTARAGGMTADVVTLNMVLHHTPAPATVIDDLARVLAPGGTLIITELCHHDQDWARSACGDLWLGFEPEELSQWARAAGLVDTSTEYLPLKNGFRVQIRQFNRPETH